MHYFIDESGDLDVGTGASKYFLIGCVVTDSPAEALTRIRTLRRQIFESATLSRHWTNFRKQGFHATSNHPDIYNRFISLLNTANVRGYFVFIKKGNLQFRKLVRSKGKKVLYDELIKAVLLDRIIKDNGSYITISFEQNLPKQTRVAVARRRLELFSLVRETIVKALAKKRSARKPVIRIKLQDKNSEPRLALVDYLNHVLLSYLSVKSRTARNIHNYQLLEKKFGMIHDYLVGTFYQPRKRPFVI